QRSADRSSLANDRGQRRRFGHADGCAAFPPSLSPFRVRRGRAFRCTPGHAASNPIQAHLPFLLCVLRSPDSELPSNFPPTSSLLAHFLLRCRATFLRFLQTPARSRESNRHFDFAGLPFAQVRRQRPKLQRPRECNQPPFPDLHCLSAPSALGATVLSMRGYNWARPYSRMEKSSRNLLPLPTQPLLPLVLRRRP